MKNKILYGLVSFVLIAVAFGVSGFLIKSKPEPKKDNETHNIMYVKVNKVNLVETESDMTYRGRVTAFDNVSLAAEVSGKIMQGDVRFKAGESFKTGDVLLTVYSEDVEAALKSGKSSFLQTLSKILPDLKVDYPVEFAKWNSFFNSVDPENPLPQLPKIMSDKEKVFLAANNVLASYYSLQQQEINLQRYTIRAPFNGVFKTVNKEIGAVASPGTELANLIRSDKLEVVVPVFPNDLKWIKKGGNVKISGNNDLEQIATISRISGFVDEETQSVNVYLTYYASGTKGFLEGEYVNIVFNNAKVLGFEIPREAVIDDGFVYELKKGKLEKKEIKVIRKLHDTFIISGIEPLVTVVTESLASVNPTMEYLARP
ncbi:HlyD family efflux transporter periplasmic adaptor subunit [Prolixibacteraceae bacterium Z1-6]|uniref:HlyD family efflux transporter periplasmic adaptor subunit n=1 Tax=Draconibacterium aestuarii TaxID=2998507 RepID=A0A9X3F4Y8_9BACT|nr:HlyD family efflux transporter periplasmic adaptor subunit [Prolixibacteraceae bacterium Z1-6]